MRILKEYPNIILLGVLVLFFVAYPVAESFPRHGAKYLLDAVFMLVLFAAMYAEQGISWKRPAIYLVALAFLLRVAGTAYDGDTGNVAYLSFLAITEVYSSGLIFYIVFALLRQVTSHGRVTRETIAGVSAVYILLAIAFSGLHIVTFMLEPAGSAFSGSGIAWQQAAHLESTLHSWGQTFQYYSVVTQTTLGYGDITPVSSMARGLAMAQTIIGQLYLAVLLARIVAMELADRQRNRDPD